MSFTPFIVILGVLVLVILGLLIYRRSLTAWEDDTIHVLNGEEKTVAEQEALARKVEVVDRWGKILTVIVVLGGLALAFAYVWVNFFATTKPRMG